MSTPGSTPPKVQFNVYLPADLVQEIRHRAIDEGLLLSALVERVMSEYLCDGLDATDPLLDGGANMRTLDRDDRWYHAALCSTVVDPDIFYPKERGVRGANVQVAARVCADCRVPAECLADALQHRDVHGIRAGLSDRELRRLLPPLPVLSDADRLDRNRAWQRAAWAAKKVAI